MEKSGSKSLHLQGGAQEDHHLAISGCRNGHGPDLNGEPYALKGARTVRGGEALTRFLLHFRWRSAFCIWWRLSTGPAGRFWRGACRTRWIRAFVSPRSTKRWRGTARRKYSTPIRARSSPAPPSPAGLEAAGIAISMDGRGRFMDNIFIERLWRSIKYEEVHLKAYADGREARDGIGSWMNFYNHRRPHQAMNNQFPMAAWRAGMGRIEAAKTVDMPLRLDNANACPHIHSRRKSSSRRPLDLKDKGRRDHTLISAIPGPRSGVHFRYGSRAFSCSARKVIWASMSRTQ
jgi:hypothetical protein